MPEPRRFMPLPMRILGTGFRGLGWVAPELTADLIFRLLTTTWRPRRRGWEEALYAQATRFHVDFRDTPLHTMSWGRGERTVLLAHGWNGRGTQLGRYVQPLTERGFRVVAFDIPGHGRTAGHRATMSTFAESILAVGAHLGPLHTVIAHCVGALSAMMAHNVGLEADRLALLACHIGPVDWIEEVVAEHRLGGRLRRRILDDIARDSSRWPSILGTHVATQLRAPTLFVHDRDDPFALWTKTRQIAAAAPGSRFSSTDGLGHLKILWDPDVVQQVVAFVDSEG